MVKVIFVLTNEDYEDHRGGTAFSISAHLIISGLDSTLVFKFNPLVLSFFSSFL
jgi:hypothetical protein